MNGVPEAVVLSPLITADADETPRFLSAAAREFYDRDLSPTFVCIGRSYATDGEDRRQTAQTVLIDTLTDVVQYEAGICMVERGRRSGLPHCGFFDCAPSAMPKDQASLALFARVTFRAAHLLPVRFSASDGDHQHAMHEYQIAAVGHRRYLTREDLDELTLVHGLNVVRILAYLCRMRCEELNELSGPVASLRCILVSDSYALTLRCLRRPDVEGRILLLPLAPRKRRLACVGCPVTVDELHAELADAFDGVVRRRLPTQLMDIPPPWKSCRSMARLITAMLALDRPDTAKFLQGRVSSFVLRFDRTSTNSSTTSAPVDLLSTAAAYGASRVVHRICEAPGSTHFRLVSATLSVPCLRAARCSLPPPQTASQATWMLFGSLVMCEPGEFDAVCESIQHLFASKKVGSITTSLFEIVHDPDGCHILDVDQHEALVEMLIRRKSDIKMSLADVKQRLTFLAQVDSPKVVGALGRLQVLHEAITAASAAALIAAENHSKTRAEEKRRAQRDRVARREQERCARAQFDAGVARRSEWEQKILHEEGIRPLTHRERSRLRSLGLTDLASMRHPVCFSDVLVDAAFRILRYAPEQADADAVERTVLFPHTIASSGRGGWTVAECAPDHALAELRARTTLRERPEAHDAFVWRSVRRLPVFEVIAPRAVEFS
jgi:hypothetical protein